MLDIGWQEIFIIGALALIVVGPKDLPRALRTGTKWLRKAKGLAREFQSGLDEVIREADLDDVKKEITEDKDLNVKKAVEDALDKDGLDEELALSDSAAGLELEGEYQSRKAGVTGEGESQAAAEPAEHELDSGDDDEAPAPQAEPEAAEPESEPAEPEPAEPPEAETPRKTADT